MSSDRTWTRRAVLAGGVAVAVTACSGSSGKDAGTSTTAGASSTFPVEAGPARTERFTTADFEALGVCDLTPEQTAGPFPLDEQFVRTDITEGVAGTPLRLGFRVLDVVGDECGPAYPASVEVWHADATGDYSAFTDDGGGKDDAEGTTFLRGTQQVTNDGIAQFETIYPGWYTGRAVHIHVRVRLSDDLALTTQVYFDPEVTEQVYADAPYAEFGSPDTSWDDDAIAGDPAADGTALALTRAKDGTVTGLINLGIPV
jgi:protocatechuate 3,4-dioxygenase beta subunit